jgi:hypothetical protein
MEHLNEKERRAAVVASMLHDIGWSQIEKVDERFISIQARLRSEVSEVQAQARRDDRELRILHQDLGVALARTLLADSEWDDIREEVCLIIGDHDTRDAPPVSRACEVMWDSDMLWRTTLPHANMLEAQAYVPGTQVISAMEKWSRPEHYRTTAARQIATQEFGVARTQFVPRV